MNNKKVKTTSERISALMLYLLGAAIFLWSDLQDGDPQFAKGDFIPSMVWGLVALFEFLALFPNIREHLVYKAASKTLAVGLVIALLACVGYFAFSASDEISDGYKYLVQTGVPWLFYFYGGLALFAIIYYFYDNFWQTNKQNESETKPPVSPRSS